jgi:Ca2+/H+ antiporter
MKKFKKFLKIAFICELILIPGLAVLFSGLSCRNNTPDCGLAGFNAIYMIFPIGLTVLLYVSVKTIEFSNKKSGNADNKPALFKVLLATVLVIALGFFIYFQSIS